MFPHLCAHVPYPPAPHSAEDTPYQYLTGFALVTLQPFVDMGLEIGQTAAPPVGLPSLASTYNSECAQPVLIACELVRTPGIVLRCTKARPKVSATSC